VNLTSLAAAIALAAERLAEAGVELPRAEARLLLARATGIDRTGQLADPDRRLDDARRSCFEALIDRRAAREPMAYILGEQEFWSLAFSVGPGVLVPRPESETLIEAVLEHIGDRDRPWRLLDLGTGSGCLLLTLLTELPRAEGLGTELSPAALAYARRNGRRLGLDARALLVRGEWGHAAAPGVDIVVANPPYVSDAEMADLAPEVRRFEPAAALAGGPHGLDAHRRIVPEARRLLRQGGVLALEIGWRQAAPVTGLLEREGYSAIALRHDLGGRPRCLIARRG